MNLIDNALFELRSQAGCSNSDYGFVRTSCCGSCCVEDRELHQLYFDPANPTQSAALWESIACPVCGSRDWDLTEVTNLQDVPDSWRWACASQ